MKVWVDHMEFVAFILTYFVWGLAYTYGFIQLTAFAGLFPSQLQFPNPIGEAIYWLTFSAVMLFGYIYGVHIILKILARYEKDEDEDVN